MQERTCVPTACCVAPIRRGPQAGESATGTWAGYKRHLKLGERPCEPCRLASVRKAQRYNEANKARHYASVARYRKRHPDRVAALGRTARRRYQPVRRVLNQARRASIRAASVAPFSADQLMQRMSMFDGCWMCGGPFEHIDHVKPLSAGGPHCLANLRPACAHCNCSKGDRWPL